MPTTNLRGSAIFALALTGALLFSDLVPELIAQPAVSTQIPAPAVYSAPARSEYTIARLWTTRARVSAGASFYVGLELETRPQWHTYWINPGDSGMATTLRWQLPPGFRASPILWPTPRRIFAEPLMSYGYGSEEPGESGRVSLFTRIEVPADAAPGPVRLVATAGWLECKEICLPGEGRLQLPITVVPAAQDLGTVAVDALNSAGRSGIHLQSQLARLPRGLLDPGELPARTVRARLTPEHLLLDIEGVPPALLSSLASGEAYFFPEAEGVAAHAQLQRIVARGDRLRIEVPRDLAANQIPDAEVRGVLKFTAPAAADAVRALDEAWYIRAPLESDAWLPAAGATLLMFLFALAGGALLNLMPCVLPVLSLKVLALIQTGGNGRLRSGLAFLFGVLVSFLALAGVLLGLQAAGAAVGWGFQLQSPVFVLVLAALVAAFALNLLGVYEWTAVSRAAGLLSRNGHGCGHFGAGVLATILATPCTAPFMGMAMGFAFAQGPVTVLLIFTGLGLGMALPYLLLAAFPAALAWLPKPGRWMESFKQFSGFLLLATTLWLLWIFGRLSGPDAQMLALAALLSVGLCAWIYGRWFTGYALAASPAPGASQRPAGGRRVATAAFWVVFALGVGLGWAALHLADEEPVAAGSSGAPAAGENSSGAWRVYSRAEVARLRSTGRAVFIDFTADWCLSCKVNEALTFRSERVWQRMQELNIVAFQADWTRQDPEITNALKSYGRNGVPLYVLYGPGKNTRPRILPEVLNESLFLAELDKLESPPPE